MPVLICRAKVPFGGCRARVPYLQFPVAIPNVFFLLGFFEIMKKIVVMTGAGVSAESGIRTFRDSNGLWEDHEVMDVASPEGWARDTEMVLRFYNARRAQLKEVSPNAAHQAIRDLEEHFDVRVITQNVDDLSLIHI